MKIKRNKQQQQQNNTGDKNMFKLNIKLTKNKQQQNSEVILHFPTSPGYGAALKPG